MRIERFAVHSVAVDAKTEWVFLELLTDEGVAGVGEALLGGSEPLLRDALVHGARALVGSSALEAAPPRDPLADDQPSGLLEATVRSAIDQALWDLRARAAGLPLHRLLGPRVHDPIALYANINRGTHTRAAAEFAARAAEAQARGFTAIKLAPFDGLTRANAISGDGRRAFAAGAERIRAVREAVGAETTLMVDCHCRFDLAGALRLLETCEAERVDWLEDVLPYQDLDGWERLRAASRAPLVGGETARGIRDLLEFMRRGLWDVVMPDVRFFGGVTELVALGPLAVEHQVSLAPHNPRGPVATLASAHAMTGCPAFSMLEYQYGECDWREALIGGAERVVDGALTLPDTPGLGGALDAELLAAHASPWPSPVGA